MSAPVDRAGLFAILAADESLAGWVVYAEPPDQLVGKAIVITPRDPYQSDATYGSLTTYVSVSALVPRAGGPAMDVLDSALLALRAIFSAMPGCQIGETYVGVVDVIGKTEYLAAMVNLELS